MRNSILSVAAVALAAPAVAMAQVQRAGDLAPKTGLPVSDITSIVTGVMQWLLYMVGILAVIAFVVAGFLYLTAAGDEDQIAKAKKATLYAAVGAVVALLGLVVLQAAQSMLMGEKTI